MRYVVILCARCDKGYISGAEPNDFEPGELDEEACPFCNVVGGLSIIGQVDVNGI